MRLIEGLKLRPLLGVFAATVLVVALACGGEDPTNTPAPTATTPPTATPEPEATEAMMPEETAAPDATAEPGATATTAPTATPVVDTTVDYRDDWVNYLLNHAGYKSEWGEPQYGGIYKTADPRPASRFQSTLGYSAFSRWQFAAHNSLMMQDPWGEITDAPICDLCESF